MNALKTLLAGAALAISAVGANAATYATEIIDVNRGACTNYFPAVCDTTNPRYVTENALGAEDGKFFALGLGGDVTLGFGQTFGGKNSVSTFEVTYSRDAGHDEAVEIWAVLGSTSTLLGTLTNVVGSASVLATVPFEYIKLVDVTKSLFPGTTSFDGFDIDAVSVAAVPLPAAGAMLLAGLGGFAALRRRNKNAA